METVEPESPGAAPPRQDDAAHRVKAIGLMCAAIVLFSVLDATAKYLVGTQKIPVMQIAWARFVGHAIMTFIVLGPLSMPRLMRSAKPWHQILRSLLALGATIFNFVAVKYLQLDQTITIFFLTPLLVAAFAGPLLGEWIGWHRLMAVLSGFLGVILVTRPGFGGIHWAVLYSFAATLSYALYNICTRYVSAHDGHEISQFYTPLAGVILLFPFAMAGSHWPVDIWSWILIASLGLTGGIGHWLLILAHRHAPAPVLAPFVYIGLLSMSLLGYTVFGDIPTWWTLAGGAIVVASGCYLLYRESHRS